jgi:diguanylate cyclase (GGDEF)-like protein
MPNKKISIVNSNWRELCLGLLKKIASSTSYDIPTEELLQDVCDVLIEIIPASAVAIEPVEVGQHEIVAVKSYGARSTIGTPKVMKKNENTLSADVFFRHATLILTDIPNDNFVASKLLTDLTSVKTYIGTPIYVNRIMVGVLSLASTESVILTSESASWLEAITNALGSNLSIRKNLREINKSERLAHSAISALGSPIAVIGPENLLVMYNQSWEVLMNRLGVTSNFFKNGTLFNSTIDALPDKNKGVAQLIIAGLEMVASDQQPKCKLDNILAYVSDRPEEGEKEVILSIEITSFPDTHEILVSFQDITEYIRIQEQLDFDSRHDKSTGLPNKLYLQQRLELAIQRSFRYLNKFGVLFIGIDRFQHVIDSIGHKGSDDISKEFANRLKGVFHPSISLARINSDEFVLLIETMHEESDLEDAAARIEKCLSKPFVHEDTVIHLQANIGISVSDFDDDSVTPDTLLRRSHEALTFAQKMSNRNFAFFKNGQDMAPLLKRENELRDAIEKDELVLYYQPEVELATGKLIGMEALIRWRHPERGLVAPGEFIPLAEDCGLIIPIFDWVMERAVSEISKWGLDSKELKLWVNASAHQFAMTNLTQNISKTVEKYNVDFKNIGIEITENVLMEDADSSINTLRALRDLGLSLSVDDFGTGYSSLAYLRQFPIDIVKIDRTFINGLGEREDNTKIVNAVIAMVHELGLEVLAEGIEEVSQLEILQNLKCEYGQGFLFSRPVPEFPDPHKNFIKEFLKE